MLSVKIEKKSIIEDEDVQIGCKIMMRIEDWKSASPNEEFVWG